MDFLEKGGMLPIYCKKLAPKAKSWLDDDHRRDNTSKAYTTTAKLTIINHKQGPKALNRGNIVTWWPWPLEHFKINMDPRFFGALVGFPNHI